MPKPTKKTEGKQNHQTKPKGSHASKQRLKKVKSRLIKQVQNLFNIHYRTGTTIVLISVAWLLIGYLIIQQLIYQEAFVFFISSGLLWLVGNITYLTHEFVQWKKRGLSIALFFGLFLTGLVLLGNQQVINQSETQNLGYQLMLLALGNMLVGITEVVFRFFIQQTDT